MAIFFPHSLFALKCTKHGKYTKLCKGVFLYSKYNNMGLSDESYHSLLAVCCLILNGELKERFIIIL